MFKLINKIHHYKSPLSGKPEYAQVARRALEQPGIKNNTGDQELDAMFEDPVFRPDVEAATNTPPELYQETPSVGDIGQTEGGEGDVEMADTEGWANEEDPALQHQHGRPCPNLYKLLNDPVFKFDSIRCFVKRLQKRRKSF